MFQKVQFLRVKENEHYLQKLCVLLREGRTIGLEHPSKRKGKGQGLKYSHESQRLI